jgi:uncharacterized protein with PQ loop repeat
MHANLPVLAGETSPLLFMLAALPMLAKALRSRDLASYSLSHIVMMSLGYVVHAIYVYILPPGPIWALHRFWLVATGLMVVWYLKYEWRPHRRKPRVPARSALSAGD